jgi:hypothetical protein
MRYLKSTRLNGVRQPDEEVDEDYVQRYVGKETLQWFRNLGGSEEVRRRSGGVIVVKSTSPDGKEVRETVFTPLPETER